MRSLQRFSNSTLTLIFKVFILLFQGIFIPEVVIHDPRAVSLCSLKYFFLKTGIVLKNRPISMINRARPLSQQGAIRTRWQCVLISVFYL